MALDFGLGRWDLEIKCWTLHRLKAHSWFHLMWTVYAWSIGWTNLWTQATCHWYLILYSIFKQGSRLKWGEKVRLKLLIAQQSKVYVLDCTLSYTSTLEDRVRRERKEACFLNFKSYTMVFQQVDALAIILSLFGGIWWRWEISTKEQLDNGYMESSLFLNLRIELKRTPNLEEKNAHETSVLCKFQLKRDGIDSIDHRLCIVGANHPNTTMFLASWPSTVPIGVELRWIPGRVKPKRMNSKHRAFSEVRPQRARHTKQPNPKGGSGMK